MSGSLGNLVGQRLESGGVDIEETKTGEARITKQRALHVNLRDNDGAEVTSLTVSPVADGTKRAPSSPATISSGGSGTQIVAANASRKGLIIQNVGTGVLFLGRDNTVTSSNYTVRLKPGASLTDDISSDAWFGNLDSGSTSVAHEEVSAP